MAEPGHPGAEGKPVTLREGIEGADTSGIPLFNDRYAQTWARIKCPRGMRLKTSAHSVLGQGFNNCVKSNPNLPCCTLPKMQTGRGFATIAHWNEPRALSIGEAKRIASYPDEWITKGDYSAQWACIGNSVPPLFMRAIAGHVRREMLDILSPASYDEGSTKERE